MTTGTYILRIEYKEDRTVEMGAESLSEAIQYGLKMLGTEEGTIKILKLVDSIGVPRISKVVLVTTIKQVREEKPESFEVLLSALMDKLESQIKEPNWRSAWWLAWDTYQTIGELLQKSKPAE